MGALAQLHRFHQGGVDGSGQMAASSGFVAEADRAASLAAVTVALGAAAAVYMVSRQWWARPGDAAMVVPVFYALAAVGAALCVFLLVVRARLIDDPASRWVAAGIGVAGVVAAVQGVLIVDLSSAPIVASSSAAAGLYLIWHAALVVFVLGAVVTPDRRRPRQAAILGFGLLVGLSLWEPTWLPLPELVDGQGVFTAAYAVGLWTLVGTTGVISVVWIVRAGRRASWPQTWVGVALVGLPQLWLTSNVGRRPAGRMSDAEALPARVQT